MSRGDEALDAQCQCEQLVVLARGRISRYAPGHRDQPLSVAPSSLGSIL